MAESRQNGNPRQTTEGARHRTEDRGRMCLSVSRSTSGFFRPLSSVGCLLSSAWRQDHDHLPPFEPGVHLDLGELLGVAFYAFEQPGAEFLMGHFAAAEAQGHLDLIAFLEEALHRPHLHVVVM